jgi:hypothetical protein
MVQILNRKVVRTMSAKIYKFEDFQSVSSVAESYFRMLVANAMLTKEEQDFQEFKNCFEQVTEGSFYNLNKGSN